MRTRRSWIVLAWALLLGLIIAIAAQGCGPAESLQCPRLDGSQAYDPWCTVCAVDLTVKGCNRCLVDPILGPSFACSRDGGADAATDSAITDGGATGCAGDCVPAPPFGWEGPGLFWPGTDGPAPACPASAPVMAYQGHADLVTPDAGCTLCTCSAPSGGTCAPPLHLYTSASSCALDGAPTRTFDPPPAWDGSCTAFDAVAAGDLCNGAPCAASLTCGPLVVTESACTPSTATLLDAGAPSWTSAALACLGVYPVSACNDLALACAPSAAQAAGFITCIFQKGDNDCPAAYPMKHLAYSGFQDQRGCTPCSCDAPDSSCTATLEVFADGACTKPVVLKLDPDAGGPSCGDLAEAGVALGSKQLALAYDPGACAPDGGGPSGSVQATGPSTFCCLMS